MLTSVKQPTIVAHCCMSIIDLQKRYLSSATCKVMYFLKNSLLIANTSRILVVAINGDS